MLRVTQEVQVPQETEMLVGSVKIAFLLSELILSIFNIQIFKIDLLLSLTSIFAHSWLIKTEHNSPYECIVILFNGLTI